MVNSVVNWASDSGSNQTDHLLNFPWSLRSANQQTRQIGLKQLTKRSKPQVQNCLCAFVGGIGYHSYNIVVFRLKLLYAY